MLEPTETVESPAVVAVTISISVLVTMSVLRVEVPAVTISVPVVTAAVSVTNLVGRVVAGALKVDVAAFAVPIIVLISIDSASALPS